jgi:hypothetical protein
MIVTVELFVPESVHIAGVLVLNVTGLPDPPPVADTVKGGLP